MIRSKSRSQQSPEAIGHSRSGDAATRWPGGRQAFRQEFIADLTPTAIAKMDRDELIDVIRSVRIPFLRDDSLGRLEYWDTATLRRTVHLACRCYQPQYY